MMNPLKQKALQMMIYATSNSTLFLSTGLTSAMGEQYSGFMIKVRKNVMSKACR